ncbi:hypothetical protein [Gimesia sp.]|uniref:hypothetical protein n=1 Tax=Gimesia sp. TaxID=2024833 RepID=UPI003A91B6E6
MRSTIFSLFRGNFSWSACILFICILVQHGHAEESATPLSGIKTTSPVINDNLTGELRRLNATLSKGIAPRDNAVVILVKLFGTDVFEPALKKDSLDMLGIESVSAQSTRFQYVADYVKEHAENEAQAANLATQIQIGLVELANHPWQRSDNAAFADYLTENKEALDLFVAASELPKYYAPLLCSDTPSRLISASLAVEFRLKFVYRCLIARALLRVKEKDVDGAFRDLLACHRMARLLAAGSPFDVSIVKAHVIEAMTCQAETGLIESGILSGSQAQQLLKLLLELPDITAPEVAADMGERAIIQQEIELLQTDRESVVGFFEHGGKDSSSEVEAFQNAKIQWDLAKKRADEIQDGVVQALSMHDKPRQQLEQFQKLNDQYEQWLKGDEEPVAKEKPDAEDKPAPKFEEVFRSDPEGTSRWIGEAIAYSLRTNCWQRKLTHSRGQNRKAMVLIGLALVVYRSQHETYPTALSELTPEILAEVPLDMFSHEPFQYTRDGSKQARLTSWGANQANDAGKAYNDDQTLQFP